MANAAAKKAAAGTNETTRCTQDFLYTVCSHISFSFYFAARSATASSYKPILIGINIIYILLKAANWQQALKGWQVVGSVIVWILQYAAYKGILESSETHVASSSDMAGGMWLDLLGLVVVVQLGTAAISNKFYWLLMIVPPFGLWKLYSTFKKSMPGGNESSQQSGGAVAVDDKTNQDKDEKRRKRAERRRQKWS